MKTKANIKNAGILPVACLGALLLLPGCEGGPAGTVTGNEAAVVSTEMKAQGEDMGKGPWALDIEEATVNNTNYRAAKWTGGHMQMVLMSLKPGEEINLEVHKNVDQFFRVEQGEAHIRMGKTEKELTYDKKVTADWAFFIPAGYYHHVKNIGKTDLKVYTIYAPAQHPKGVVLKTYEEARKHEEGEHDNE